MGLFSRGDSKAKLTPVSDPTLANSSMFVSSAFHSQKIDELRTGLAAIETEGQAIMNRKLRGQVFEMCAAIREIISIGQSNPDSIMEASGLNAILAPIPEALREYSRLFAIGDPADRPRLENTAQTVTTLTQGFLGIKHDMLEGSRLNLNTLNRALSGVLNNKI